jgi:putative endopeptidase
LSSRQILAASLVALTCAAAALLLSYPNEPVQATASNTPDTPSLVENIDKTCKPCEDFQKYATGGWEKRTTFPGEFKEWGSFTELVERNEEQLRKILEATSKTPAPAGGNEQKIGDFYASCMDEKAIDAQGIQPLAVELAAISAIHDRAGLITVVAHLQLEGVPALFAFTSNQDFKDSSKVLGDAAQGGLGLPDRDYYTREDADSKRLREQYVRHTAKLFELAGDSPENAASQAATVLAVETSLAKGSMTNVEQRDPNAIYHKLSIKEVAALTPNFSWDSFFRASNIPSLTELNVEQPNFFKTMNGMLAGVPLEDWKTYLRARLLDTTAPALSHAFDQEAFDFTDRILGGAKEQRPRYKRCIDATDKNLGEALGQIYVRQYFPPESKARVLELVHNLIAALHDDLQTLDWMSPATRKTAITKLEAFGIKIGYPDVWRDYASLSIDRGSYLENTLRGTRFESARKLAKIGKPVDRLQWDMTPPTVNAYYQPQLNEIVFPAGILEPPFYDPARDDAYNYGGIGAVIGHEITHGFDDEGAQFDLRGNLKNWWTPSDLKNFQERGNCVAKQFDGYTVEGDLHENGKLVEGESIADLGGLAIAYAAYKKSLEGKPQPQDIDGFPPQQRFFLGYAEVWRDIYRPEYAKLLTNTDPHPLSRFRVNGPLSNLPIFASAFGCKKSDAMVREQACRIW